MKIKICYQLIIVLLLSAAIGTPASAQVNTGFNNAHYVHAVDLYEKGLYMDAEVQFGKAAQETLDNEVLHNTIISYRALCAIKLQLQSSEAIVRRLDGSLPNNPKLVELHFTLAKYLYNAGVYKEAVAWFETTDNRELVPADRLECLFMQAHSYFKINKFDKALELFSFIKIMPPNKYTVPATYYYAHVEYLRKNYLSAITGFEAIRSDPRFSALVTFYILQIHAYQQQYKEVIAEGTALLKVSGDDRYAEIAYLVAHAYFKTQQYEESLQYFELYNSKVAQLSRDDFYLRASLNYLLKQYPDALRDFDEVLLVKTDSLAQNAYYYAGDIALKTDDKKKAFEYFTTAGKLDFDYVVKDVSLFNAAKLSLELHNDTELLYAYSKANPQKEINRLLSVAYTVDKQYDKAIGMLLALPKQIDKDYADIQRIAFMRAMSSYDSTSYDNAIKHFDYSLKYSKYDSYLAAMARYWKAEALYKKQDYQLASKQYEEFILSEGSFIRDTEYQLAHYNIAYCAFKRKDYEEAITWFRKFVGLVKKDSKYLGSAYNSIGDCYFIQRNYAYAAENYDKTIQLKADHIDYALYQKALAVGLEGKPQQKLEILNILSAEYSNSDYAPVGIYEMGRTYLRLNKFDLATKSFMSIIQNYPKNVYCQLALMELGLVNVNTGDYKAAIEHYKQAVLFAPDSPEAKNALLGLKNACIETNNLDSYFAFVDNLKLADTSGQEQEKEDGRFAVAEKMYLSGDCEEAAKSFKAFLQTYPKSIYAVQANFYIGDCVFRKRQYDEAKKYFAYVVAQPRNSFTELAMLGYARSAYRIEDYDEGIKAYEKLYNFTEESSYKLEASCRITEANFQLEKYQEVIESAQRALSFPSITEQEQLNVMLMRAKSVQQLGRNEEAMQLYRKLSESNIRTPQGAEAAFLVIDMLYQENLIDEAIKEIFDFSDRKTNQQYWLARSFILLGDIYLARDEPKRAQATYKSLSDEYKIEGDGIIDAVKSRLAAIQ